MITKNIITTNLANAFFVDKVDIYIQSMLGMEKVLKDSSNGDDGSSAGSIDHEGSSDYGSSSHEEDVDASTGNLKPGDLHDFNFNVS